jgi:DNA-directed RNA polymerase subunit F
MFIELTSKVIDEWIKKELESTTITASEAKSISKKNSDFLSELKKKVDEASERRKTIEYVFKWIKWAAENGRTSYSFNEKEVPMNLLGISKHFEELGYKVVLYNGYGFDHKLTFSW